MQMEMRHRRRARAPMPARDAAMSQPDTVSLILAWLLDLNELQKAAATCKTWRTSARAIRGWRLLKHKTSVALPSLKTQWKCGGPQSITTLPPFAAGIISSHPVYHNDCVAVVTNEWAPAVHHARGLVMNIVSIEGGHQLAKWKFPENVDDIQVDEGFFVKFFSFDSSARLLLATERWLFCFELVTSGTNLADVRIIARGWLANGLSLESPPCGICVSPTHLFMAVNGHADDPGLSLLAMPLGTLTSDDGEDDLWSQEWLLDVPDPCTVEAIACGSDSCVAIACMDCVYLLESRFGDAPLEWPLNEMTARSRLPRRYSAGGTLVQPFDVALTQAHLLVLDDEARGTDSDRLVVIDRLSDAPLQVLRFGPCGVANLGNMSLALAPDSQQLQLVLRDAYLRKLIVLSVESEVAVTADECIHDAAGQRSTRYAARGHGHGALGSLEAWLALEGPGDSGDDLAFASFFDHNHNGKVEESIDNCPKRLWDILETLNYVTSQRDRLWLALCVLLLEEPYLRTALTIPSEIIDRFWAEDRFHFGCGSRDASAKALPMNRKGLRQLALVSKPVAWKWACA